MRRIIFLSGCLLLSFPGFSKNQRKKDNRWLKGMYVQWGYNTEWYTRSTIHFRMSNGDRFILHQARAHDKPDMQAITHAPLDISIPQYNYRIGFYLNKEKSRAIELNFDHAKYVVTDGQQVHVTGVLDGEPIDDMKITDPETFLHFEHTDGANWFHFNYVSQQSLWFSKKKQRNIFTYLWKAGAGFNVPRTDFTYEGDRLNNKFHLAGYNLSAEGGIRYFPFKSIFLEGTAKTGYVRYVNALANTETTSGNRASQGFGYLELIATIGFDIHF